MRVEGRGGGDGRLSNDPVISDVHNTAKPRKVLPEFAVAQVQSARSLAAAERHVARIEAGRAPMPRNRSTLLPAPFLHYSAIPELNPDSQRRDIAAVDRDHSSE